MSVLPIFLHPRKCVCLAFSLPFYLCNVYNNLFCARYLYIRQLRKTCFFKILIQGKLFQRCTHFLYCSVLSLGWKVNTRRMSQLAWHSIFHIKNSMKYSGHRKLLCEFSKLSKLNAFILGYQTNTDASILVYKFRPERTGFNMYAEYTRPQLTFFALVLCISYSNGVPDYKACIII